MLCCVLWKRLSDRARLEYDGKALAKRTDIILRLVQIVYECLFDENGNFSRSWKASIIGAGAVNRVRRLVPRLAVAAFCSAC